MSSVLGFSGLTSALCLGRSGFQVTVIADRFAPRVTSVVAGALWEWPPAACGMHHVPAALERSKAWCEASYQTFSDLSRDPKTGVFLRPVTFYFKRPVLDDPRQRDKMNELRTRVVQFRHDQSIIGENGISTRLGFRDAYTHLAPMIDTDVYMGWLFEGLSESAAALLRRGFTEHSTNMSHLWRQSSTPR